MTASSTAIIQILERALQCQIARNLPMAEALYRQVLERQPRNVEALHHLGMILHGKTDAANKSEGIKLVEKSLKLLPGNLNFIINLSTLYIATEDWANASRLCKTVISSRPTFAGGHHNMGCVLQRLGKNAEAEVCFLRAIQLDPKNANSYACLGIVYEGQRRFDAAKAQYGLALSIDDNCYDALAGLGKILQFSAQFDASCQCLMRAVQLRPSICNNYTYLADSLAVLGQYSEALQILLRGLQIDKNHYGCRSQLILIYGFLGRYEEATLAFVQLKALGTLPITLWSNYLLTKLYDPAISAEALFELHAEFGRAIEAPHRANLPKFIRNIEPNRRIRIGYVSGDFHKHSVANFILPILENHDHSKFEIYCYSNNAMVDETTHAIISVVDRWQPIVVLSEIEIRDKIRADELDILIDLSGHTGRNILGILAQKLAPIQVTWIGYPGTTGLTAIDYRITDANLDPVGITDRYHTEKLLRLPISNATFRPEANSPDVSELPALKNGYLTFACLNLSKKINASVVACWAPILLALPTAKLILCDTGDADVAARVLQMFAQHGVQASQLQTKPRSSLLDFLALHREIDLALDPFPYNGGTTNLHALWMGVPMLTLPGATTVSNVGAAVLRPLQLDEFIATSAIDYAQKAISMANNLAHLATIRATLRDRVLRNLATSDVQITRGVEQLLQDAWQNWCANSTASHSV